MGISAVAWPVAICSMPQTALPGIARDGLAVVRKWRHQRIPALFRATGNHPVTTAA